MEFYSESNKPPIIAHKQTSTITPIYEEVINTKTNKKELKKVGETNVYQRIQESRDSTDIQKIIERYQINLNDKINVNEEILDYTNNPTSLIDAHAMIVQAENIWNKEAQDVKQKFNNNFVEYLAAANSGELKKVYEELAPKKFKKAEQTKVEQPQKSYIETPITQKETTIQKETNIYE